MSTSANQGQQNTTRGVKKTKTVTREKSEPPTLGEYYGEELFNLHLGDTSAESNAERIANQAAEAGSSNILASAMGMAGEIMSLPMQLGDAVMIPMMALLTPFQGIACLPMAAHLDPVVGVDVHFVTIPPAPAPVPMPHPYISIIMDPKDWVAVAAMQVASAIVPPAPSDAASGNVALAFQAGMMAAQIKMAKKGMNATVAVGGMIPRAVTGAKNDVTPHFPMGAGFHAAFKMIRKSVGHVQLGSLFVNADYEPLAGLLHLNNNCWDIGLIELMRKKTKPEARELFQPTGMIMALPKGIIVNPVPTPINPLTAPFKLLKFGLAKALHALVNKFGKNQKRMNAMHSSICKYLGHPVDAASGELYTDEEDFNLSGPIPLEFKRTWYSKSVHKGQLGTGWHHTYDRSLEINIDENRAEYHMDDGRSAVFALPHQVGKPNYDRENKLHLHISDNEEYYIEDGDNQLIYFTKQSYPDADVKNLHVRKLRSIANRNGFAIRLSYDQSGNLESIIDSAGRLIEFNNDDHGRINSITAPDPQKANERVTLVSYSYNDNDNLIQQTNSLGDSMYYVYQGNLLVKETWQDGQEWFFRWEGTGTTAKCVETWGGTEDKKKLHHYQLTYELGLTNAINGEGEHTSYYHKGGLVYKEIDGNGKAWQSLFNKHNELEVEIDPLENETRYTHDEFGNLCHTTDAEGGFVQLEYNDPKNPNRLTEWVDANGAKTELSFDVQGNVVERKHPTGEKTTITYEDGLPKSIVDELGQTTHFHFDRHYNLSKVDYPTGVSAQYEYDLLGRNTKNTNPNGVTQRLEYDLLGRVTRVADYDGNDIKLTYDAIDNLINYKDAQREVKYEYEGLFKLRRRSEAGTSTYFFYDKEQRLKSIKNEQNLPYLFTLDKAGNVIKERQFDQSTRTFERDDAGRVVSKMDASGKVTKYVHDRTGRITEITYHDDSVQTFAYNSAGQLIQANSDDSEITLERDQLGNVTKETVNGQSIVNEYNSIGQRIGLQSSMGASFSYDMDEFGNISKFQAASKELAENPWEATMKYDKLGQEINRALSGGLVEENSYDQLGRLTGQEVGHGGKRKRSRSYNWGINDRLKSIIDSKTGQTNYQYDKRGYLSQTNYSDGTQEFRMPDKVGNLFETKEKNDRTYGNGGRLEKKGSWHYKYDADGFLIEKYKKSGGWLGSTSNHWKYNWNVQGMLETVTRPDLHKVHFTYDALGRRLSKKFKNTTTKWLWDGNVPLHEWKENSRGEMLSSSSVGDNGVITWVFEEGSFIPTAKLKNDKKFSILVDHLGTPTSMFNEEGESVWERSLDSFGGVKEGSHRACPFMYQGQYYDKEIELAYNRFRYYDPEDGRYISVDPIGLDSQEFNFYSYVNEPNSWFDPLGLVHKNSNAAKGDFELYIVRENADPNSKILKIGKAKTGDVMASGRNRRQHTSERIARKKYPNAVASTLEKLPNTTTGKAKAVEAKRVRTLRNQGHELPENKERKKSYQKSS